MGSWRRFCWSQLEHLVSNSFGLVGVRPGDRAGVERVRDLVERGWYREPDQEPDRSADDDEVDEDRDGLGDAVPAEPLDSGTDRSCERDRQEKKDEDAPHLPEAEGERTDRERGGRRLCNADSQVAVALRVGVFRRRPGGGHQTGTRAERRDVLCGTTRPVLRRARVRSAPKAKPPTCAKKATPPPFAADEVRPAFPSTSW